MQNKNKHLTFQDRVMLEDLLNRGVTTFSTIAEVLKKDPSTLSKEVRKHQFFPQNRNSGAFKTCVKRQNCTKQHICKVCKLKDTSRLCSHCSFCEDNCNDFDEICPKRKKAPYVCNGCKKVAICSFNRALYKANKAQKEYESTLKESRALTALNKPSTYTIDEIVSPALKKGQSIHHIYEANKDKINVSERTLYNMAHQEILSVSLSDLPRTVQRRIPKEYKYKNPKDKAILEGRTYIDFINYHLDGDYEVLQSDTVIGSPSGKVLLTLEFVTSKLLLAFLMKDKTIKSVSLVFYHIRSILCDLGISQKDLMPIILTDNGSEFNNPLVMECDSNGEVLSKVFYCNPNAPFQKGNLENNHTNLRRILPKGTSFDNLAQEQINIAISHVNSLIRKSCMNMPSYDLFCKLHKDGKRILDAFGIRKIDPKNVTLKPGILKRN